MGVATLSHNGKVLRFRTDPNSIRWNYKVNTKVDDTYGGWVVQILSANIDDLTVTADAGGGGWAYQYQVAQFFRDMLFDQREGGGKPGIFSYPPRGWEMAVYAKAFPFSDDMKAVAREFTMQFKIQEDVSGIVTTSSINAEIARLKEGVGWKHNEYNTPIGDDGTTLSSTDAATPAATPLPGIGSGRPTE